MRHRKGLGPGLNHTATNGRLLEGNIGGGGSDEGTAGGDSGNYGDDGSGTGGSSRDSSRFNSGGGGGSSDPDPFRTVRETVGDIGGAIDSGVDTVTDTVGDVSGRIDNTVDSVQDRVTVDDAGDFGDDTINRGDGPSDDNDLPDPTTIDAPDNQDGGTDDLPLSYRTPGLVDDLNQQVDGRDLGPEDVDVSIDRGGNDGTVEITAELSETGRAPNPDFEDSVSFDNGGGQRTTSTAPDPTTPDTVPAVQQSTDRIADDRLTSTFGGRTDEASGLSIGGTTIAAPGEDFPGSAREVPGSLRPEAELVDSDLPTTLGGQRDAVSDSLQQAIPGVSPEGVNDAPLRTGLRTGRQRLSRTVDNVQDGGGGAAGGVAGAAAFGVAAPEPVSTGLGAATLAGIGLGAGITGVANELGNPEDRDDLPGETPGELGQPTDSPTVTREIDVPDRSPGSSGGEIGVPDRTPSTTTGEIGVPDRTPATTTGEVGVPSIDAQQQFAGQQSPIFEEEEEQITDPTVGGDDPAVIGREYTPADPFVESPQERGGTPDRFIDENRDPFVFPGGSPVGTGTEPAEGTSTGTTTEPGFGVGSGGRPGIDTDLGLGVGGGSQPGIDTGLGAGLGSRTDAAVRADTAPDTAQTQGQNATQTGQPTANNTANQTATSTTTQNVNQTTTTTTTTRNPNRPRFRRPRFPDEEEPDRDDEEEEQFGVTDLDALFDSEIASGREALEGLGLGDRDDRFMI